MEMTNVSPELVGIKDGLKALIVERLKLDVEPQSIKDDAPLFGAAEGTEGGLSLDSVEALEIVVGIEERWGVVIQDDSVANEFYSVDTLATLVSRLLAAGASQAAPEAVGA